jgi:hypothetical protein
MSIYNKKIIILNNLIESALPDIYYTVLRVLTTY